MNYYFYAILSVIVVSLISVVVVSPFFIKKKVSNKVLVFLLSLSVGVLLATVFFGFIPEIYLHEDQDHDSELLENTQFEDGEDPIYLTQTEHYEEDYHDEERNYFIPGIIILAGFLLMFIIEKFIHYHHSKECEHKDLGHSHAYSVAPINLIGDGVHNFIDGLIIAGSYIVSIPVGIAATISVIFHEIPQEVADFGILIYAGYSKKKALFYNFLFATTAIIGTVIGLVLNDYVSGFVEFVIPFAAGNFLYIASSNLLPQLHKHCKLKDSIVHITAIVLGILLVLGVNLLFPHSH